MKRLINVQVFLFSDFFYSAVLLNGLFNLLGNMPGHLFPSISSLCAKLLALASYFLYQSSHLILMTVNICISYDIKLFFLHTVLLFYLNENTTSYKIKVGGSTEDKLLEKHLFSRCKAFQAM